jgi:hypothetical protein
MEELTSIPDADEADCSSAPGGTAMGRPTASTQRQALLRNRPPWRVAAVASASGENLPSGPFRTRSQGREYGAAAAANCEQRRPTIRGFKIAHGKLGKQLRTARARGAKMSAQRQDLPKRVEVRDLNERAVVKLATERKHLTDIIKMVAYQAESDLLALLRPHYARADQEGRTLLHELFATAGDIRVGDSELHITLAPLSSPHRTHAAQALCEMLDQAATILPGSRLRMRFAVRPPPRIGLAFPGPRVEPCTATAATGPRAGPGGGAKPPLVGAHREYGRRGRLPTGMCHGA